MERISGTKSQVDAEPKILYFKRKLPDGLLPLWTRRISQMKGERVSER